ncbi:dinitrogenase iron-molybdenum cofactor biosynthesis protein [Halosquirtibacter laminarini]|uniref:Dinitrogenase iron-molybdenum cofactor biosynthesis protein n=1 Tax=Halosquirtibacter laminarini TaxID=3374600 RepID=A0AC61NRC0_9BACT|nr:dinitrogenase iron-molybdenum cofactor biosynthesis protein [Prolixibacteraceae bacterium]
MKIVVTSMADSATAQFDRRFGRASWFCLFDTETEEQRFIENEKRDASNGAGLNAASIFGELGVTKVISGDFGPKAKELLNKFEIQMVTIDEVDVTIDQIIEKVRK